ncbi:hypothetical protein GWI33_021626 [Rhynchophorus ferrugineus]|uniref:Uncharacterized protein n=1 Tax=Rhynchophorus ferrugineus TaxID=354439 RepID=A0A834J118_RHYFE|nr:hypothetical protein GWI33_021626 [Rhynchophorus ferrugineus]
MVSSSDSVFELLLQPRPARSVDSNLFGGEVARRWLTIMLSDMVLSSIFRVPVSLVEQNLRIQSERLSTPYRLGGRQTGIGLRGSRERGSNCDPRSIRTRPSCHRPPCHRFVVPTVKRRREPYDPKVPSPFQCNKMSASPPYGCDILVEARRSAIVMTTASGSVLRVAPSHSAVSLLKPSAAVCVCEIIEHTSRGVARFPRPFPCSNRISHWSCSLDDY